MLKKIEKTAQNTQEFTSCNILEATVDTNIPQGGDTGHGGETQFELRDSAGTDWTIYVDGKEVAYRPKEVVIALGGDSEGETFTDALMWAGQRLKAQIAENKVRELNARVRELETQIETLQKQEK
jgi:hypothetical protein